MKFKLMIFGTFCIGIGLLTFGKTINTEVIRGTIVKALVVPHHSVARDLVIRSLEPLRKEFDIQTIIVLSPNHFEPKGVPFTTADTIHGVEIDREITKVLLDSGGSIVINNDLINNDHGIMVPAKILSDLFPKAKFVTLLVSTKTTDILASVLVEKLKRVGSEKKILVVGSVDFAHNLSVIPAMQNNQETIDAISNRNYAKIKDFGDEHLDSPVILEILMKYSYTDNNGEWETWANSHSSLLMDRPNAQGTSYVVGVLRN